MEIILPWIIFSFIVGFVGTGKNIGFWGAFLLSLFLSPIIGLIIALTSKDVKEEEHKKETLQAQKDQKETLEQISEKHHVNTEPKSIADELEKLKKLRDQEIISEEEYQKLRSRIID